MALTRSVAVWCTVRSSDGRLLGPLAGTFEEDPRKRIRLATCPGPAPDCSECTYEITVDFAFSTIEPRDTCVGPPRSPALWGRVVQPRREQVQKKRVEQVEKVPSPSLMVGGLYSLVRTGRHRSVPTP